MIASAMLSLVPSAQLAFSMSPHSRRQDISNHGVNAMRGGQ
jgi:hypothetical protein